MMVVAQYPPVRTKAPFDKSERHAGAFNRKFGHGLLNLKIE